MSVPALLGFLRTEFYFPLKEGTTLHFSSTWTPGVSISRVWDQENSRRWAWKTKEKENKKAKNGEKQLYPYHEWTVARTFVLQKSVSLKHEHGLSRQWCSHAAPESFACCSSQQISYVCPCLSLSLSSSSLFPFSDRGSDHRKWIKSRRLVKTPPKKKSFWGSAETWGAAQASGEPECLCRAAVKVVRDSGLPYS